MTKKIRDEPIKIIKVSKILDIKMPPPPTGERKWGEFLFEDFETIIINRGTIINAAIKLEEDLEDVLEMLLRSDLYESTDFGKEIWRLRNIDFFVKWNLLRGLKESHSDIKKDINEWSRYITILNEIASIRNNFAHGRIYFAGCDFHLLFVKENRLIDEVLDNIYFTEIEKKLNEGLKLSKELISKLQECKWKDYK